MVYVEAMSQGCIPIAEKNDGIDGVVVNGKNRYLTELGNTDELATLLAKLSVMDKKTIETISKKAYETASMMTTEQLAESLLHRL